MRFAFSRSAPCQSRLVELAASEVGRWADQIPADDGPRVRQVVGRADHVPGLDVTERRAGEDGAIQVDSSEICPAQVRPAQIRMADIGSTQVGTGEVAAIQKAVVELGTSEVCVTQINTNEIWGHGTGTRQIATAEFTPVVGWGCTLPTESTVGQFAGRPCRLH